MEKSWWQKAGGILLGHKGRGVALGLLVAGVMVVLSFLPFRVSDWTVV